MFEASEALQQAEGPKKNQRQSISIHEIHEILK
jgi:hypothetical protein